MRTYIHICTPVFYTRLLLYIFSPILYMQGRVCVFVCALCIHAHTRYMRPHTHTYTHTCIYTYTHTFIHTYTHTHTHTHTLSLSLSFFLSVFLSLSLSFFPSFSLSSSLSISLSRSHTCMDECQTLRTPDDAMKAALSLSLFPPPTHTHTHTHMQGRVRGSAHARRRGESWHLVCLCAGRLHHHQKSVC